ncbi:MAG: SIS domain-containing protein [Planctomycetota bacterium]|nr:SIS domain-containing protein [Planctomycetota bacterium]
MTNRGNLLDERLAESIAVVSAIKNDLPLLVRIANHIAHCLENGGTLYFCGNGGSAADAQHIAAEFVGRFLRERRPLAAIALPCNSALITALGNDYSHDEIFSRQVEALTRDADCVIGISTSGTSRNILRALEAARSLGASTIGFTGLAGDPLAALSDLCFRSHSTSTPKIQEAHIVAWHLVCELVDEFIGRSDDPRP